MSDMKCRNVRTQRIGKKTAAVFSGSVHRVRRRNSPNILQLESASADMVGLITENNNFKEDDIGIALTKKNCI